MHIINKKEMLDAMKRLAAIVEKRVVIDDYQMVWMAFDNNELDMRVSDGDMSASVSVASDNDHPAGFAVNFIHLLEILKKAKSDTVKLSLDGSQLKVQCGRSSYKLDAVQDVSVRDLGEANSPDFYFNGLVSAIEKALPFVSDEPTRYYLNGVHVCLSNDGVHRVCATNGHIVIARYFDSDMQGAYSAIIPTKACEALLKLLDGAENIAFFADENKATFKSSRGCLTTKLIDDVFPDVERVVPSGEVSNEVSFDRLEMVAAIEQVSVFKERTNKVHFKAQEDEVVLTQSVGSKKAVVDIDSTGEIDFHANGEYMQTCLKSFDCDCVGIFQYNNNSTVVRFNVDSGNERDFTLLSLMRG